LKLGKLIEAEKLGESFIGTPPTMRHYEPAGDLLFEFFSQNKTVCSSHVLRSQNLRL
jgi:hypothetical protein